MKSLDEICIRRRFLVLSALRWFPGGLVLPVLVLLMLARGLDIVMIGTLFAAFSGVVALFELPTGGLADVVGRRPVFLWSATLGVAALVMLASARNAWQFAVALSVFALGRALSSGPLHAWYVDSVQATNPKADLQPAVTQEGLVTSVSIGLGVLVGGVLPGTVARVYPHLPRDGGSVLLTLTVPIWLAAALLAVATVAIAALMTEPPHPPNTAGRTAAFRRVLADVPRTVSTSLRFARRDRAVVMVLSSVFASGLALAATEVLAPTYFAATTGNEGQAAAVYSVLLTAVFFASGFGSAVAPLLARLCRGPMRGAAVAAAIGAAAYAGLGTSHSLITAAGAYIVVYVALGVVDPLRLEQLHYRTNAAERSSMLSVESMAQMLGGLAGSVGISRLAQAYGFQAGWLACGLVVLVAGALALLVSDRRPAGPSASSPTDGLTTPVDDVDKSKTSRSEWPEVPRGRDRATK